MTWTNLRRRLRAVESEFVAAVRSDPSAIRETRQRVAQEMLLAAMMKRCSLSTLTGLFKRLNKVGFTGLAARLNLTVTLARECADMGYTDYAVALMIELIECIGDFPERYRNNVRRLAKQVLVEFAGGGEEEETRG